MYWNLDEKEKEVQRTYFFVKKNVSTNLCRKGKFKMSLGERRR